MRTQDLSTPKLVTCVVAALVVGLICGGMLNRRSESTRPQSINQVKSTGTSKMPRFRKSSREIEAEMATVGFDAPDVSVSDDTKLFHRRMRAGESPSITLFCQQDGSVVDVDFFFTIKSNFETDASTVEKLHRLVDCLCDDDDSRLSAKNWLALALAMGKTEAQVAKQAELGYLRQTKITVVDGTLSMTCDIQDEWSGLLNFRPR